MFLSIQILLIIFGSAAANSPIKDTQNREDVFDIPMDSDITLLKLAFSKERSSNAFTLVITHKQQKFTMILTKITDNILMNSNMGIWNVRTSTNSHNKVSYEPKEQILKDIGKIIMYQDNITSSAVTLFPNANGGYDMDGIIHDKYIIQLVPLKDNQQSVTGYLVPRSLDAQVSNTDNMVGNHMEGALYAIFEKPLEKNDKLKNTRSVPQRFFTNDEWRVLYYNGSLPEWARKPPPTIVYPKILVPLYSDFIWLNDTVSLVKYMISYWNVVDMVFRKLHNPEVRLSLAGFIIPLDERAMPYLESDILNEYAFDAQHVLNEMGQNFYLEEKRFPADNYNIIIAMTTKVLCSSRAGFDCKPIAGKSYIKDACLTANHRHRGGTGIVRFNWSFGGISSLAYHIANLIGADPDDNTSPDECASSMDYIMSSTRGTTKKLDWSPCSKTSMGNFLRSDDATCLHAKPTFVPLTLKALKGTWLPIDGQCKNDYEGSVHHCILRRERNICMAYGCQVGRKCLDPRKSPMNGSNCTTSEGDIGYCYQTKCLRVP